MVAYTPIEIQNVAGSCSRDTVRRSVACLRGRYVSPRATPLVTSQPIAAASTRSTSTVASNARFPATGAAPFRGDAAAGETFPATALDAAPPVETRPWYS